MSALRSLPLTVRVPALVALLMVAVSAVVSQQVLSRLAAAQRAHLEALAGAYLDGLSTALQGPVLREDVWEVFDQLDRSRRLYEGVRPVGTVVTTPDGTVIAASDPRAFPTQSRLPDDVAARFAGAGPMQVDEARGRAYATRRLDYRERPIGAIRAELDIHHLLDERRGVLGTLIATNAALTLLLAGAGWLAVRRMVRPIEILAAHLERGRDGPLEPVPLDRAGAAGGTFRRLFERYNALVRALCEREALAQRLAEEEKLASLGRLASGLAHEINNPLGGLLNVVDTLRAHGGDAAARAHGVDLLDRGLRGLRDVVRTALMTYKGRDDRGPLRRTDIDDLRFLLRPELRRRAVTLDWRNDLPDAVDVPGGPVRQAVLNLLLNACGAAPAGGRVAAVARVEGATMRVRVRDDGPGMPADVARALERRGGAAFAAGDGPPPGRGIGLWMVRRLLDELGGTARVVAGPGTTVEIGIPLGAPRAAPGSPPEASYAA